MIKLVFVCSAFLQFVYAASDTGLEHRSCLSYAEGQGGRPMPGGWTPQKPGNMDTVDEYIIKEALNARLREEQAAENSPLIIHNIEAVYTQVVAGTNYCIKFTTGLENSTTQDKKCSAKIYKPLPYMVQGEIAAAEVTEFDCKG